MVDIETRKIEELKPHAKNADIYNDTADATLITSINKRGIMDPLIITEDNIIISGHRRFAAAKECNLKEVPVIVYEFEDELDIRHTIIESNINRVKTNEQIAREARELIAIESVWAKQRKRRKPANSVTENLPEQKGDARDKVGKILNISGKTVDKAIMVVNAADELESEGKQNEADKLRKNLNKSIDRGYNYAKREGLLQQSDKEEVGRYITLDAWKKLSTSPLCLNFLGHKRSLN